MLDIATLALLLIFSSFIATVILFLFSLQNNNPIEIVHWTIGNLTSSIGVTLIIFFRDKIDPLYSILLGNFFIILGYFFYYAGLLKFTNKDTKVIIPFFISIVFLIPFIFYYDEPKHIGYRILANSAALMLYSFLTLYHLIKYRYLKKLSGLIYSISFLGTGIVSLIRISDNLDSIIRPSLISEPLVSDIFIFSWGILSYIVLTAGAIILYMEKINTNINIKYHTNKISNDALGDIILDHKKFLSLIAHEFLTPLSTISASKEILKKENVNNNVMEFERIDRSIDRLAKLTDDILYDSTKPNSIDQQKLKPIRIKKLLIELCHDFQIKNNIDLNDNLSILAEEKLFKLLISNLITNAIKFSRNKNFIFLSAHILEDQLEINAINDGEKLKKDLIDKFNSKNYLEPLILKDRKAYGLFFIKDLSKKFNGSVYYDYDNELNKFTLKFKINNL